jgi:putative oxygen-independent coproporphyrinogen III oxidase
MPMRAALSAEPGFGIYVHWPFCLSKCPYCDFNSHVRHATIDQRRYQGAFAREIGHRAALLPGRKVASIFFGGGTPSLMQPATVAAILDAIAAHWELSPDIEVTLEANPTSVEAERFKGYRHAGVNRLSLGVQALNDFDLRALGRRHNTDEALRALDTAQTVFQRTSFDLIYARPGQSIAAWRTELAAALDRASGHLSLYQLTIEPGTMFDTLVRAGKLVVPGADMGRHFWDVTQELMSIRGYPAYEISNHARPGEESRHNLVYWRYGEYAGIGPGAHGRLQFDGDRVAQATEPTPERWLEQVERLGHGLIEDVALSVEEAGDEFLLMGLRLTEGIDPARFETVAGRKICREQIDALLETGMIAFTEAGRLRITAEGFPVLDAVVADLAA